MEKKLGWFIFDSLVYKFDADRYLDLVENISLTSAGDDFYSLIITTLTLLCEERGKDASVVIKVLITDFENEPVVFKFKRYYKDKLSSQDIDGIIDRLGQAYNVDKSYLKRLKFEFALLGHSFVSFKKVVGKSTLAIITELCDSKYRFSRNTRNEAFADIYNIFSMDNEKLKLIHDVLKAKDCLNTINEGECL